MIPIIMHMLYATTSLGYHGLYMYTLYCCHTTTVYSLACQACTHFVFFDSMYIIHLCSLWSSLIVPMVYIAIMCMVGKCMLSSMYRCRYIVCLSCIILCINHAAVKHHKSLWAAIGSSSIVASSYIWVISVILTGYVLCDPISINDANEGERECTPWSVHEWPTIKRLHAIFVLS